MSKTMIVFPGQGSQFVGMGASFRADAVVGLLFAEAEVALGFDLGALMAEGPMETLTLTQNAQPALLLAGVVAYKYLKHKRPELEVGVMTGHSLGEYTAVCCAGGMGLGDALRVVRARGEAMARAENGGMLAVLGLGEEACAAVAKENGVYVANVDSDTQVILAGALEALNAAGEAAKAAGARRVMMLPVSGAFHTPSMAPAAGVVREMLGKVGVRDLEIPVIGCVFGKAETAGAAVLEGLVAQITAPVRWHALMQRAVAGGVDTVIELGAGTVLGNLAKRMMTADGATLKVHSLDTLDAIRDLELV